MLGRAMPVRWRHRRSLENRVPRALRSSTASGPGHSREGEGSGHRLPEGGRAPTSTEQGARAAARSWFPVTLRRSLRGEARVGSSVFASGTWLWVSACAKIGRQGPRLRRGPREAWTGGRRGALQAGLAPNRGSRISLPAHPRGDRITSLNPAVRVLCPKGLF